MVLNEYSVAFLGHRIMADPFIAERRLEEEIFRLLKDKNYVVFTVGRNGDFDLLASAVVTRLRLQYRNDNSSLVLYLPYPSAEYQKNKYYYDSYYTDVEICHASSIAHPKKAISIRNREMVDRSDLVLCYIEKENGGAWNAVKYAIDTGKEIINLAEDRNR